MHTKEPCTMGGGWAEEGTKNSQNTNTTTPYATIIHRQLIIFIAS